jgi:hypothetical protein
MLLLLDITRAFDRVVPAQLLQNLRDEKNCGVDSEVGQQLYQQHNYTSVLARL